MKGTRFVVDVMELASREGRGGRVDLLGHSMGGKAAMVAATTSPDLFERLIIEDISPRRTGANPKLFRQFINGMIALDLSQPRKHLSALLESSVPDKSIRDFLLTNVDCKDGQQFWKVNLDAVVTNLDEIMGSKELVGVFPRSTLFLHGGNSNYVLSSDHDLIKAHFPAVTIQSIAGAGHWLHAEKPSEFIAAVLHFLSDPLC